MPVLYERKEMGIWLKPYKQILLFESFIREKLGASRKDQRQPGALTNVGCPFCGKGTLKLNKTEAEYSCDPRQTLPIKYQVGNQYEFTCSRCNAIFFGSYVWLYIDYINWENENETEKSTYATA